MLLNAKRRTAVVAALATAAVVGLSAPAYAALATVGWSTSQPQPGALNARYTWTFTTGLADTIKHVLLTVPTGTTVPGSLTVSDLYGVTTGTATLTGTTVDFTLASSAAVSSGTQILISLTGFTNTPAATAGSYTSAVSVQDTTPTTLETGTSNSVTFNDTTTAVKVVIAQSTAFSSNTTGFTMLMDPSVPGLATQTKDVILTVSTNAANGYTLGTKISQQPYASGSTATLAAMSGSVGSPGTAGTNTFGYTVSGHTGVGTVQGSMGGGYAGYTVGGYAVPFSATAPTNSDTVTLTNEAKIDYLQKADTYVANITYSVTPSY